MDAFKFFQITFLPGGGLQAEVSCYSYLSSSKLQIELMYCRAVCLEATSDAECCGLGSF